MKKAGEGFAAYQIMIKKAAAEKAKLFSYYLERGFSHEFLSGLDAAALAFYRASMEFQEERRQDERRREDL